MLSDNIVRHAEVIVSYTLIHNVVYTDIGVACKLLVATEQGMLEIPVNRSTTPPLFGRPRQIIAGK